VVDESVALGLAAADRETDAGVTRRFRTIGLAVATAWIVATAAGAYGGQLLGDPEVLGLDAAFPAGFLALLAPWLRSPAGRRAAVTGALLAVALTPVTPPGVPLLAAALGAVAGWRTADTAEGRRP
jgi:predicted branched-subunit amino acid permease